MRWCISARSLRISVPSAPAGRFFGASWRASAFSGTAKYSPATVRLAMRAYTMVIRIDRWPGRAAIASRLMPRLKLGGQRVPEPVRADVADSGGAGGFGDGPVGEPGVEEVFELGVQRDVAAGAELAERDVQPVGGADLHDRVDGEVQELAFAQAGAGQELHGQVDERVRVGAGGLQQLGERAVV